METENEQKTVTEPDNNLVQEDNYLGILLVKKDEEIKSLQKEITDTKSKRYKITYISTIITLISIAVTIYFGFANTNLENQIKDLKEQSKSIVNEITNNTQYVKIITKFIIQNNPNPQNLSEEEKKIIEMAAENTNNPTTADDWALLGYNAQIENKYDDVIKYYSKAIELNPDDAVAYYNRGLAYYNLQQYEKAIADYNKAIELKPDDADIYNNRGNAYCNLQQNEKAITDYNKTIELKPDLAEPYYNFACLYSLQNEKNKAFEYLEKSFEKGLNIIREYIENDKDFENIKTDPRFKQLLDKYF
ncbi:MAG: tetratricopeptide repeat protein [Prevotellaceae bacterium]|jgi:tetratricopeptide (TPR) repeat protein|nr:tetratricopeptide repeat protein [Prevotellaceae bacterium]